MKQQMEPLMQMPPITQPLLEWYHQVKRDLPWRQDPTPYHVWISEIMLQQTRVEAVKPYYARWMEQLPTVEALAQASEEQVLKLWEGLGYYNRARNLQKAARQMMERHGGRLPESYEQLLELTGIGSYTAGAVASIAYGIPVPAVDGNVLRVVMRLTGCYEDITKDKVKKEVTRALYPCLPTERPGDFNQAMMELGALVCLPNGAPKCESCPLWGFCKAKDGSWTELPVKQSKKPRKIQQRTILVLQHNHRVMLQKRPQDGLLPGLWQWINWEGRMTQEEILRQLEGQGIKVISMENWGESRHIFTHLEWEMEGWKITTADETLLPDSQWVEQDQLEREYALPSALRHYTKKQQKSE